MLLPQSPKKSKQVDLPPLLETPEECRRAEEQDQALTMRAKRREAEAAADRARFELSKDKLIFSLELALAAVALVAVVVFLAINPELIPVTLLGGGGLGGFAALLKRQPGER